MEGCGHDLWRYAEGCGILEVVEATQSHKPNRVGPNRGQVQTSNRTSPTHLLAVHAALRRLVARALGREAGGAEVDLGFGYIFVSEIAAPNMLANLV
jgi:hypothetical protein